MLCLPTRFCPDMARYSFLIEYDGGPYKGWQRQDDMPSVQGALEAALERPDFSLK